jgi:hypothetical protein
LTRNLISFRIFLRIEDKEIRGMEEEWRDIPGFEGVYQVSNLGGVKRLIGYNCRTERLLKPAHYSNGYLFVSLCVDGKPKGYTLHRLVASAFIGVSKQEVNHKDGNKENNCVDNLEYSTRHLNNLHAYRVLGRSVVRAGPLGEKAPSAKLNTSDILSIREMWNSGSRNKDLSERYGVSPSQISRIVHGHEWKHI